MRVVNFKSELPNNAQPGERVRVGAGSAWRVFKFNKHTNSWALQYWSR